MRTLAKSILAGLLAAIAFACMALAPAAYAQSDAPRSEVVFAQAHLDQMLAPIALYPDALLSQILMASTYPQEVAEAARWSRANPHLQGDQAVNAVAAMDWDPSVRSLAAFPEILTMMDDKLEWTQQLGDAFLSQQPQVLDTVQGLRERAYAAGNLNSTGQLRVERQGPVIVVESAQPQVVYVPYYDPVLVYGPWWWPAYPPVRWNPWPHYFVHRGPVAGLAWGGGIPVSAGFFFGGFDWHRRQAVVVNGHNYYSSRAVSVNRGPGVVHAPRHANAGPGSWRHDPAHRHGVAYRKAPLREQSSRASTLPVARRDVGPANAADRAVNRDAAGQAVRDRANAGTEGRPDTRDRAGEAASRGAGRLDARTGSGNGADGRLGNPADARERPAWQGRRSDARPLPALRTVGRVPEAVAVQRLEGHAPASTSVVNRVPIDQHSQRRPQGAERTGHAAAAQVHDTRALVRQDAAPARLGAPASSSASTLPSSRVSNPESQPQLLRGSPRGGEKRH